MQTADWQVNKVNIVVNCSKRFPVLNFKSSNVCLRDRDSVKAFHNNVYLIFMSAVCIFSHTEKFFCAS